VCFAGRTRYCAVSFARIKRYFQEQGCTFVEEHAAFFGGEAAGVA
jgi:hypothetical protein